MASEQSPHELGYRFPAEWEEQEAVWFAWPVRDDLWGGCLDRVLNQLAELYVLAACFQKVRILCPSYAQESLKERMKLHGSLDRVELFDYEVDDVWIRDYGPLFLLSEESESCAISDWRFNAWGNKFPKQKKDDAASAWIAAELGLKRFPVDAILEGGAIESDGAGTVLTTEVVLLNSNRNDEFGRDWIEGRLREELSVGRVLWLEDGLVGDDTDGHIDNLARFASEKCILMAVSDGPSNPNFGTLQANRKRAESFQAAAGTSYEVILIPLPDPLNYEGEPLAASYMNYVLLNGAVLVPTYGQPVRDQEALRILEGCFPTRKIIGFDCRDIIKEGGALHCMSQHQPKLVHG